MVQTEQVDLGQVQADELCIKVCKGRVWQAMALAMPTRLWLGGAFHGLARAQWLGEGTKRPDGDSWTNAHRGDFALMGAGPCDPQVVLQNPHISLYCLDHPQQRALFIELDDG